MMKKWILLSSVLLGIVFSSYSQSSFSDKLDYYYNNGELAKVLHEMEKQGLDISDFVKIKDDKKLMEGVVKMVKDQQGEFTLYVDYNNTVRRLVHLGGFEVQPYELQRISVFESTSKEAISVKVKLFSFNTKINTQGILSYMEAKGYRPANPIELLFLGILKPDVLLDCSVVSLEPLYPSGSDAPPVATVLVQNTYPFVKACIAKYEPGYWSKNYSFLAVKI